MNTQGTISHVYSYKGRIFVPTVGRTEAGFLREVDPVEILSAPKAETLAAVIEAALGRGNPILTTPARQEYTKPVLLLTSGARSWPSFENEAQLWRIQADTMGIVLRPTKRMRGGGFADMVEAVEHVSRNQMLPLAMRILEWSGTSEARGQ